ncbi:hypothetical protein HBI69_130890 [Parastagonospora nodorum]|nr:hypothetical protein HBI69_130890 [Parastagonospora nodorum]
MLEGLAAIGLAGNIIQFVSFSSTLISQSREIYQSASGVSAELLDLNTVSRDLKTLNNDIATRAEPFTPLHDLAQRSVIIAKELLGAISVLQKKNKPSGRATTKWQSFQTALKCIWKKEQIDDLKSRLGLLREQVSLHLINDTRNTQDRLLGFLEDWKRENVQTNVLLTYQVQGLEAQLRDCQRHISSMFADDHLKKLCNVFSKVSNEYTQLSRSHMIVQSLRYERMEVRNEAIKDALKWTFDWIFASDMGRGAAGCVTNTYVQWLQSNDGIYWITGKPGSGKSTFMKYLFNHAQTAMFLRAWSGGVPLVRASFYFWNPGEVIQKSLTGLLQTLLYHIFRTCPGLVPVLCPERSSNRIPSSAPWTLSELQKAFTIFQAQPSMDTKFYFQIDGLDEYSGDTDDVIKTLRALSIRSSNVKLCISSRPWNCFQDAFGTSEPRMLRLHEYTRRDIEFFARKNLKCDTHRSNLETPLYDDIIPEIVNRAEGVFLWVRLVVRSLREGIMNDDPISIIQRRLQAIPTDLEEFFEHILASVEDVYSGRLACTFLAALKAPRPLMITHYYFLENEDLDSILKLPSVQWNDSTIQEAVRLTLRRLNGQFRGLLEPASTTNTSYRTTVDFLHRTLRDFLLTDRMMNWLKSRASSQFNVFMALSRTMIATYKFIDLSPSLKDIKIVIELSSHAAHETGDTVQSLAIVDMAETVNEQVRPERLHKNCGMNCYIVRFAISVGHTDYLRHQFDKDEPALNFDRILKHVIEGPLANGETYDICLPQTSDHHVPPQVHRDGCLQGEMYTAWNSQTPAMLTLSLARGANPNAIVEKFSSWIACMNQFTRIMDTPYVEQCWQILETFLTSRSDLHYNAFDWLTILRRGQSKTEDGLHITLRFLRLLLKHDLDPNIATHDTTLFTTFLHTVTRHTLDISDTARVHQNNLLREFLRAGGDVTLTYRDTSSQGWLNGFAQNLTSPSTQTFTSLRIIELQILLEHGLDPNTVLRGNITIWYRLLGVLHHRLQQGCYERVDHKIIHRIILLCLHYKADPHAPGLPRMLDWMRGKDCLLSVPDLQAIKQALPSEADACGNYASVHLPSCELDLSVDSRYAHKRRAEMSPVHENGSRKQKRGYAQDYQ